MPKRTKQSLLEYKKACREVYKRAGGVCEVLVNGERCQHQLLFEDVKYINFAHRSSRSGKTQEWVNDPNSIIFSCSSHHLDEEYTGKRMESVKYNDDFQYIPDPQ
jgi:hypothetical protein